VLNLGLFSSGESTFAFAETPAVTTGVWHHVVATYSGTSTVAGMNIYVDGVNQPLTVLNNNLAGSIVNTTTPAINGRGGASQMSTDFIDEIRVSTKGVVFSPAFVTASLLAASPCLAQVVITDGQHDATRHEYRADQQGTASQANRRAQSD